MQHARRQKTRLPALQACLTQCELFECGPSHTAAAAAIAEAGRDLARHFSPSPLIFLTLIPALPLFLSPAAGLGHLYDRTLRIAVDPT